MPQRRFVRSLCQVLQIRRRRNQFSKVGKNSRRSGEIQRVKRLDETHVFRKPVRGLVGSASRRFGASPTSYAARPASTAALNAAAIRTGSAATAIAVFTST